MFDSMPHDASLASDEQQRLFAFLARVNEDAQKSSSNGFESATKCRRRMRDDL